MEEKYKHKIITIPNVLSFFRLLLIPVIVWLYIVKKDPILTMVILALSGITGIVVRFPIHQREFEEAAKREKLPCTKMRNGSSWQYTA